MAKFLSRLFGRGSSFRGSQTSLQDNKNRNRPSNNVRTSASLENLASYHVIPKELDKNKLHKASWEGNLHKVERLARPGQINVKDQQMRTPLHLAVVKGHIEIVKYLVQEGAKLDVVDNDQRTPLIKAVLSGNQNPQLNYQICQILINGGAGSYINAVDKHGRNALHYAIDFGNQYLVNLFLSNDNCDPNFQDRDQMTPLHLAIKRNSPEIVQLLLSDQQADPNIVNRYGQTPLHMAASVGYTEIIRLLLVSNLDEPCDPTIVDSQQLTAYELAKVNHQEACANIIEEYQNKWKTQTNRRPTSTSLIEQPSTKATSSISMNPAVNLQRERDETSDDSSSISTNKPLKSSPIRTKRPSDQWSDDNALSIGSHGLIGLYKNNPLQSNETKTGYSALNNLVTNNPLQTNLKKTTPTSQQTQRSSFFGIGPVVERVDSDNTSTSMPIDKLVKPIQTTSQNKPVASNLYVNTALQPVSNTKSWSDDTITLPVPQPLQTKKSEPQSDTWDSSISDDLSISKPKHTLSNLIKTQPLAPPPNYQSDSDSDINSVETEIRKFDIQKPTTIQNLVNQQIGNGYKIIGPTEIPTPQSDDSSWTTTTKGIQNLIQKPKINQSTWDDSRPLSTDIFDISEVQTTGIENLTKIIDTIMHSNQKQTSSNIIGKLLVSSMVERTDSILSETISHDEDYEQNWKKKTEGWSVTSTKASSFNDVQFNELKENIKQLERNQEDTRELKRQLRNMENKKNDFEKLYKENDQMLRDIENKLQQETNEKQRLEWTTKNLNIELKNIKQKLQSLEDEKDLLNQRCIQLKQERDNHDEKLRILQSTTIDSYHDNDINKMKYQHRQEMKSLSDENNDLHYRTKQLQSDLQLHKESLDVTVRYKIDLEKALEENIFYQNELDYLKHEKNLIEQEKIQYKTKYDNLQEEIRLILLDRSKLEQKLTSELQEHMQEKQRSTDDIRKYRTQIEQLNIKLDDAETRLRILQTQNQSLLTSKDRDIKTKFDTPTQHESDKLTAEQRYKEITNKQQSQHLLNEPLVIHTSTPLNNRSLSSSYISHEKQNQYLNKTFPQDNENNLLKNSRQIRSDTERVKSELDRLRQEFDKLISNYEPINNSYQQTQLHSQIDTFRQFYEQEFRQRQLLMSNLTSHPSSSTNHNHSLNKTLPCTTCNNSRLLKERLETAIDTSLADQRLQTIQQIPPVPRQASSLLTINTTHNGIMSSIELLRQRYHV